MKTTKYYIKYFTLLFVIITGTACKKSFLDETNYSSQSAAQYYATRSAYESLVTGAYSGLRTIYNSKEYQNVTQLGTDIITQNYPGSVTPLNQYTVTFDSNQGDLYTYWTNLYAVLKNINAVIDRAPNVALIANDPTGIDPNVLAQHVAEAKGLRAMILFEIVRNWGNAPLITTETLSPQYTFTLNTGAQFYTQILKDLTDAIAVLPAKQTGANYGRMSSSAAKHLR